MFKDCILGHAEGQKLKHLHINSIDNILAKPGDPFFLGFAAREQLDLAFQFVRRVREDENVGLHAVNVEGGFDVLGGLSRVPQPRRVGEAAAQRGRLAALRPGAHAADDREHRGHPHLRREHYQRAEVRSKGSTSTGGLCASTTSRRKATRSRAA